MNVNNFWGNIWNLLLGRIDYPSLLIQPSPPPIDNKIMKGNKVPYFAYGSNMLRERLERRVGKVIRAGVGCLEDYELKFNCGNLSQSYANVVSETGKKTWGVVYMLTPQQIRILDSYEILYYRLVETVNIKNIPVDTVVYVSYMDDLEGSTAPTLEYCRLLLSGYRVNGMEKSYERLKQKIHQLFKVWIDVD